MSDILYSGDIPSTYHYAIYNANYIDLYDTSIIHNGTFTYYRIYTNYNGFFYEQRQTTVGQQYQYPVDIVVSSNPVYRNDFCSIVVVTFIICLFGVWLLNLLTSLIRKGGVLGGLF